jgi:hypothetical protein
MEGQMFQWLRPRWQKPPGSGDYVVRYQFEGEAPEEMSVFGQNTREEAEREARYSLDGFSGMNEGLYQILSVERA